MDFSISQDLQARLTELREFIDSRVLPLEPKLLAGGFAAVEADLETVRNEVRGHGWWAPNHPKEWGGQGWDLLSHALVLEVLGRTPLGLSSFGTQAPDAGNIELLHMHGTPEHKEQWLGRMVRGEIRSCFAMTEPHTAGSNPVMLETRALRDGDDYVISGRKWFATGADGAALCIVMAVTNPDAPPYQRASMILVPKNTPGLVHVRNIPVMGHAGSGWISHAELEFQEVRVPVSSLLGPEGQGFVLAQHRLGPGRIHHCMRWLGASGRALDLMKARAQSRVLGPDSVLADKQLVQNHLAESAIELNAARLATLHAAWRIGHDGAKAARLEISLIKVQVAQTLQRIVDRAIQVHGALGVTDDTVLSFLYREERAARIYDGADEVHLASIAKQLLKPYSHSESDVTQPLRK